MNSRTIATYNDHIEDYVANTPPEVSDLARVWIDAMLENLPRKSRILEIGTGIGHDARYMEERGFTVQRTDAAQGFIAHLKKGGYEAKLLNILTDEISSRYSLIFADAVFSHFTLEEAEKAMRNVHSALSRDGKFALSVRVGEREGWSNEKLDAPRYFRYWSHADIKKALTDVGFVDVYATDENIPNSTWLHVIAKVRN